MRSDENAAWLAMAQAAVCESFDAGDLIAAIADPAQQRLALQQLARDSVEIERDGEIRWTLLQSARQRTLGELSQDEFRHALAAQTQDALARQLAAVVGKAGVAAGDAPVHYRALELLRLAQMDDSRIAAEDLARRARRARADLNRKSATDALQNTLRTPLRGREGALRLLRDFLDSGARAVEAQYTPPANTALHRANLLQRRWPDVPALLLSGSGGAGKSALIAELIRLERGLRWDRRIVVHFDFDEPALKAGDPGAMLLEAARQIALARPALDEPLSASRAALRQGLLEIERSPSGAYERLKVLTVAELSRWRQLFAEQRIEELLLVLDTLEEVVAVDFARLDSLFGWLDSLRIDAGLQRLRVIGSGRALVPEERRADLWPYFLAELELRDLGARAARAMLRDRLVRDGGGRHVDQVWRCVRAFGGNPLVLSILARFCAENDADALEALLADVSSDDNRSRFGAAAQRFLYGRILERVRDKEIRPLANPGLILRRVTPELIRDVLAKACGLGQIDVVQAQWLLQKLQRLAWLVTVDGDGLRHRRDVRRLMLKPILDEDRVRAEDVNRTAAQWYAAKADPSGGRDAALLESWYHRGLLGEIASTDAADLRALADHLGADVDDLPTNVRALVKHAGGQSLTAAEQSALPESLQSDLLKRQARILRREGLDSAALGKASAKPVSVSVGRLRDHADGTEDADDDVAPPASADSDSVDPSSGDNTSFPASTADPELVKALFSAGEFEQVATQLPALLASYWRLLRGNQTPQGTLADQAVYLAAVAARGFAPIAPADWAELIDKPPVRASRSSYSLAALLNAAALEILARPSSASRGFATLLDPGHALRNSQSLAPLMDWKLVLAAALSRSTSDRLTLLGALPFLDPVLVDLQRHCHWTDAKRIKVDFAEIDAAWKSTAAPGEALRWRSVLSPNSFVPLSRSQFADWLAGDRRWKLRTVNAFGEMSRRVVVAFDLNAARGSGFSPIGLVPEFYAPIRSAFQAELPSSEIATLVERLLESFRTWPEELTSRQFAFASTDRSNELLPLLLTVADYHGLLGSLVRAAAEGRPETSRLGRVARLFTAFEAAWAL